MNFSLRGFLLKIVQSFWLIPATMAVGALLASALFNWADRQIGLDTTGDLAWLYMNTPDGARSVLSVIAGSMITVTGVILSTMIVVLTLASQQYGPRLVKNFIEDRPSQFVIGAFAGCFIYSVITLKNINSGEVEFVPHLSVLFALALALLCIGLMIFFVQHVASGIQVQSIMRRVYRDLNHAVDELFPDELASGTDEEDNDESTFERIRADDAFSACAISTSMAGYVQLIQGDALIEVARERNVCVELVVKPGDFVLKDELLARVWQRKESKDEVKQLCDGHIVIGKFPTHEQDAMFPIRQMEEIAIRALSPGINDPHTAVECIDYLACSMIQLAQRRWPSPCRFDDDGKLRVVARPHPYEAMLRQAFQQIHFYGRTDISIVRSLVAALNRIAESLPPGSSRRTLVVHFAHEIIDESRESIAFEAHRKQIPPAVEL